MKDTNKIRFTRQGCDLMTCVVNIEEDGTWTIELGRVGLGSIGKIMARLFGQGTTWNTERHKVCLT